MLITSIQSEAALERGRLGVGAPGVPGAGTQAAGGATAAAPRPLGAAAMAVSASGPAFRAAQCGAAYQPVTKQQISQQDAHPTRSAANGGALGPHSARDPV